MHFQYTTIGPYICNNIYRNTPDRAQGLNVEEGLKDGIGTIGNIHSQQQPAQTTRSGDLQLRGGA